MDVLLNHLMGRMLKTNQFSNHIDIDYSKSPSVFLDVSVRNLWSLDQNIRIIYHLKELLPLIE